MPGYRTKHQTLAVGGMEFTLCALLDHEQYHDPHGEAARLGIDEDCWPLFGQVWPAGLVLAEAMGRRDLTGLRILELGAGLALASLVAHRRGADVTVSDYHPLIPRFLRQNLRLNGLGPVKYRALDWSAQHPDLGPFDLIIGSDLIYQHTHPAQLADVIDRLSAEAVEVLIVDPDRSQGQRFCEEMAELEYHPSVQRADRQLANGEAFRGAFLRFTRDEARDVAQAS